MNFSAKSNKNILYKIKRQVIYMKKNLIVSLVGGQTFPNVQFAKWCWKEYGVDEADLIFITTGKMEKSDKSQLTADSLGEAGFPFSSDRSQIVIVDENTTVSIIEAVEGETPWRIPTSEKVKKLIRYADSLGLKHLNSHQEFETVPGILTKEQQAIKDFENQFREAIFYGCGAQQYL